MDALDNRPSLKDWCSASRPQYYIATIIPITLGFVLAGRNTGEWAWLIFFLVLLASFILHLATNLANDVFDQDAGVDNANTIGGSEAQREGRISKKQYQQALILLYGLYLAISPFIILPSGQPVLWLFALFGLLSSIYYTAPPIRYGYRAMGELMVFLNMGIIMVCGAYIACARSFHLPVLAFGIVVGFMVAAILYFQSLPEIFTDGASEKRTLAVRLGMEKAFLVYILWWPLIWLQDVLLWATGQVGWLSFGWLLAIPFYCKAISAIHATTSQNILELDAKGGLTRAMYLVTGFFLILSAIFNN